MADRSRSDPFKQEEERFDMRRLGRVALWALGAALAVLTVGAAAQSETGARRMVTAFNSLPASWRPAAPVPLGTETQPVRTVASEADARRLAETVRVLSADRDRLAARLEALERGLDVTGSVPPRPDPAASTSAGGPQPAPTSAPGQAPLAQDAAAASVATRTDFGIDLGGDGTIEGLRALWATLKAQHGAALEGLRPLMAVRQGKAGAIELRLIAGPIANAAAAARLCAGLTSSLAPCQPTTFEGQRLALR
jgi:hypothetical protein